jgi:hypothetical protein
MCAEKDPLDCHRSLLVARALAECGQPISHIHADGRLESHEMAMDRLLEITGVPKEDLFQSREELMWRAIANQERRIAYVDDSRAAITHKDKSP